MAKERFDYSKVGLVKKDGITKFNGEGIEVLPETSQQWLANYGLFVYESRLLAGHEKDTISEKTELIQEGWNWLIDGMPKRERTRTDAFTAACQKIIDSEADDAVILSTIIGLEFAYGKKYAWPSKE